MTTFLIGLLFGFIAAIACGYLIGKRKQRKALPPYENGDNDHLIPNC